MSRVLVALLMLAICATAGVLASGGAIANGPEMNVSAPGQAAPGEEITIEFSLENTGDNPRGYVLNASIPESWVVVNQTSGGAVWNAAEHKWAWMTVQADSVVTTSVTIAVPENATDSYTFEAHTRDAEGRQATSSSRVMINRNEEDSNDSGNGDSGDGRDSDGGGGFGTTEMAALGGGAALALLFGAYGLIRRSDDDDSNQTTENPIQRTSGASQGQSAQRTDGPRQEQPSQRSSGPGRGQSSQRANEPRQDRLSQHSIGPKQGHSPQRTDDTATKRRTQFCPHCGETLSIEAQRCTNCGGDLNPPGK